MSGSSAILTAASQRTYVLEPTVRQKNLVSLVEKRVSLSPSPTYVSVSVASFAALCSRHLSPCVRTCVPAFARWPVAPALPPYLFSGGRASARAQAGALARAYVRQLRVSP